MYSLLYMNLEHLFSQDKLNRLIRFVTKDVICNNLCLGNLLLISINLIFFHLITSSTLIKLDFIPLGKKKKKKLITDDESSCNNELLVSINYTANSQSLDRGD